MIDTAYPNNSGYGCTEGDGCCRPASYVINPQKWAGEDEYDSTDQGAGGRACCSAHIPQGATVAAEPYSEVW